MCIRDSKVAFQIDPQSFERFAVDRTPTFVLVRAGAQPVSCGDAQCFRNDAYVSVSGDVSLDYALEFMQRQAPGLNGEAGHAALGDDGVNYTHASMDYANAVIAQRASANSLAEVQSEFLAVHSALHQRLEQMRWDELLQPKSGGGDSRSALEHVVANTYDHYLEHWLALPVV